MAVIISTLWWCWLLQYFINGFGVLFHLVGSALTALFRGILLVGTVYYLTSVGNLATLVVLICLHAYPLRVSCKSCVYILSLCAGLYVCSSRMPPWTRQAPKRSEGDNRRRTVRRRPAGVATVADVPLLDDRWALWPGGQIT